MLLNREQPPQNPPAADIIKDTTTQTFRADVIDASQNVPVLVDFWAPWCGPCKQLTPLLERAVTAARGKVLLRKMNIDEHPAVSAQLGVRSLPAVFVFRHGQAVDGFAGVLPEKQITALIERLTADVADDIDTLLAEADAAAAAGDIQTAAELYAAIAAEDRENVGALAGLARIIAEAGDLERAKAVLQQIPPAKANEPRVASVRSIIELAEQAASVGDLGSLEARVSADPDDHQARFDLAVGLNAGGQREQALGHLIDMIRRDRTWNEEAARKQLIQLFDAWGPKDPLTLTGRRRLSSLLFS